MKNVLMCIPVDRSGLPQIPELDDIKITDLYTIKQCRNNNCRQDVWVGPRQMELAKAFQDNVILCFLCGVAYAHQNGLDLDDVQELGGGHEREGVVRTS